MKKEEIEDKLNIKEIYGKAWMQKPEEYLKENEVDKYEIFVKLNKVQKAYAFFMVCKQTMRQGLYAGITKKFGGL